MIHVFNKSIIAVAISACCVSNVMAKDVYVNPNSGSDAVTSGTLATPFKTIKYALENTNGNASPAVAGDTILLLGGRYREATVDLSAYAGTETQPITIKAADGAKPILDGTNRIKSTWTATDSTTHPEIGTNPIYQISLGYAAYQLWEDKEPLTLARFPNAKAWSDTMWDRHAARRYEGPGSYNGTAAVINPDGTTTPATLGKMIDDESITINTDTLAGAGVSFNGAIAVMNARNWNSYARVVQNHLPSEKSFEYDRVPFYTSNHGGFFLEGGVGKTELTMVDEAGEWAFDETNNTLFLWPSDGLDPSNKLFRAKERAYAFSGAGTTKHIVLENLAFFGTTVNFAGSDNITIRHNKFEYPSFSKRALGSLDSAEPTTVKGVKYTSTNIDFAEDNILYDNTFEKMDGTALYFRYTDDIIIDNNLFHAVDYAALGTGFALDGNSVNGPTYRYNTLDLSGDSEGYRLGILDPVDNHSLIEFNYHSRNGTQQTDGGSVQYSPSSVDNSINRYNWFINNERLGFRFDGDPAGNAGTVHHNVSISEHDRGFRLKGDNHTIYNNTAVNVAGQFNVATEKGGNAGTETYNNLADLITDWPVPGTSDKNVNANAAGTSLRTLLRNPKNLDFRPTAHSLIEDQGKTETGITNLVPQNSARTAPVDTVFDNASDPLNPEIGAYQLGDNDYYWIPGRREAGASHPVPQSGSDGVKTTDDLMWRIAKDGQEYKVYLSTDENDLGAVQSVQKGNIFTPSNLQPDTVYYWRVDSFDSTNIKTKGEVWSFDTTIPAIDIEIHANNDTWVNASNSNNYGTNNNMRIDGSTKKAYLSYAISGISGTIVSAKLKMTSLQAMPDTSVYSVTGSFDETLLSGSNDALVWDTTAIDTVTGIMAATEYEFDVSSAVTTNKNYVLGINTTGSGSGMKWSSSESSNPPILVLSVQGASSNNAPYFVSNSYNLTDGYDAILYEQDISAQASDPDAGDALSFSLAGAPSWLSISSAGILAGIPTDTGTFSVGVKVVDDQGASAETTMTLKVL